MRLQERWVDTYKVPGQYVPIQEVGSTSGQARLYALSSSPYAARRDSSLLDASIVEVAPVPISQHPPPFFLFLDFVLVLHP